MIQYLKNLQIVIARLWSFGTVREELKLSRITERYDVVERVPAYTPIKF